MAKIVSGLAWHCERRIEEFLPDANSTSQKHHFFGFDARNKYQLVMQHTSIVVHAQHSDGFELVPDAALQGLIGKEWGYGVDSAAEMYQYDRSRNYCFVATARSAGTGRVLLKNEKTGMIADQIEIEIVPVRQDTVRFYTIEQDDNQHVGLPLSVQRKYPHLAGSGLEDAIDRVNEILTVQAGITLSLTGPHSPIEPIFTSKDWGDKPDLGFVQLALPGMAGYMGGGGATWKCVWIWDFNGPSTTLAQTMFDVTFLLLTHVNADPNRFAQLLAHEFIHRCCGESARGGTSHDNDVTDLMHDGMPHGYVIRKARAKKIMR